jgi:hypothetical protein
MLIAHCRHLATNGNTSLRIEYARSLELFAVR